MARKLTVDCVLLFCMQGPSSAGCSTHERQTCHQKMAYHCWTVMCSASLTNSSSVSAVCCLISVV
jgi:hypothetical protein